MGVQLGLGGGLKIEEVDRGTQRSPDTLRALERLRSKLGSPADAGPVGHGTYLRS
jgi:hypothetical protein